MYNIIDIILSSQFSATELYQKINYSHNHKCRSTGSDSYVVSVLSDVHLFRLISYYGIQFPALNKDLYIYLYINIVYIYLAQRLPLKFYYKPNSF